MLGRAWFSVAILALAGLGGCDSSSGDATGAPAESIRPRSHPVEFVGMTIEKRIADESELLALLDPIFGAAAQAGSRHEAFEIAPGLYLTVSEDPRTTDQVVLRLDMRPYRTTERRTVARVPVSFAYGAVYVDAVRVALATTLRDPLEMKPWHLEYTAVSANGGRLVLQTEFRSTEEPITFRLITESPETSLMPGEVNTAAFRGEPYEKLSGTVFFELSRDEFDFFSKRAYGVTAGAEQNFADFQLLPHDWLRITVTPQLDIEMVDVAFEVVTLDGRRLQFARSPASYVAGDQFRENVFLMVQNMRAQEEAEPGSSTPFRVPFHYDDPEGGGVVNVIAEGERGLFRIAYAVESPIRRLRDVDFLPFQGVVELPDPSDTPVVDTTCEDLGTTRADRGTFSVRFDASPTVRESDNLTDPLVGPVWMAVYRAADVTIAGPRDGAEPVADFHIPEVDIREGTSVAFPQDFQLLAGDYQILGFMDIDGNADPASPDPDAFDPVTLPIGRYELSCAQQPITIEFALLLPEGR